MSFSDLSVRHVGPPFVADRAAHGRCVTTFTCKHNQNLTLKQYSFILGLHNLPVYFLFLFFSFLFCFLVYITPYLHIGFVTSSDLLIGFVKSSIFNVTLSIFIYLLQRQPHWT